MGTIGGAVSYVDAVPSDLADETAVHVHELHAEHRLQHRVILRPDRLEALGSEELLALERA